MDISKGIIIKPGVSGVGRLNNTLPNLVPHPKQIDESVHRAECGMLNGHHKWDLAKSWLTMTNDSFFDRYGFNWVPPIKMYENARKYL
jgi:hypothetical protein